MPMLILIFFSIAPTKGPISTETDHTGDFTSGVQNVVKALTFCCSATKLMCYYGNCPTFSACEQSLWWPPSSHLGLIPEMIPLYCSHCHSYWELLLLLLPVLPLGSRVVGMNTGIPFVWIVAAAATGNVNPPKVPPACPDSTSSMHPVHTYKCSWMLDPRSEFGKSKLWSTV
jgi:hypothetical protein